MDNLKLHKLAILCVKFMPIIFATIVWFLWLFPNGLYAIISLLVSSYIVDKVIIGISDNKVFYIITDKPLEIREYIIKNYEKIDSIINL